MQENEKQQSTKVNLWDTMFKTILQEMPQMVLPLINEAFEENYDIDTKIISLNNEFYNGDGSKVVSDTTFLVNHMLYHLECQFSNDKEMAFRMFEYDFHIAVSDTKREKRFEEVVFPKSCVVYITTNQKNPKSLRMKIKFPNGEFLYEVPTIRVQDYSLENIRKKRLLLFLPYLVLQYSQKLKNKKPPTIEEIKRFYRKIISILEAACQDKVIEIWEYNMLLEMIKKAQQHIFGNYPEMKKEVDSMVANVLNLQSLKMRDELKAAKQAVQQAVQQAEE